MVTIGSRLEGELIVNLFTVVTKRCFQVLARVGGPKNHFVRMPCISSVRGTPGCQVDVGRSGTTSESFSGLLSTLATMSDQCLCYICHSATLYVDDCLQACHTSSIQLTFRYVTVSETFYQAFPTLVYVTIVTYI